MGSVRVRVCGIRLPNRGGNWTNSSNAGRFALNLNNTRSNRNVNRGGRPAWWDRQKPVGHGWQARAPHEGLHIPGQAPKPHRRPAGPVAPVTPRRDAAHR